jgi:Sulfotransferase domain
MVLYFSWEDRLSINIAMWSGPRNISTAMMYAFGNRTDCVAWDEPFYAFSLVHHGNDHPMKDEIIAANDSDYGKLVARCVGGAAKPVFYQKHMTHHMAKGFDRAWMHRVANAFLIRAPERVLASYARKWSDVSIASIGFRQQLEIFDHVAHASGEVPPVIDAEDILQDPEMTLKKLCARLGIGFDPAMLSWPAGPKTFDGVWAPHWYNAAWASTGFQPAPRDHVKLPDHLQKIADEARPLYERLRMHRIKI